MVVEFGLEGNQWVRQMYEKRKMWATAHIRGNFFAGFRTTSRCEGLNLKIGRYLSYTRQRELEADFESIVGDPVLLTPLEDIERFAAKVYTRKIFLLFRRVLERASKVKVLSFMETPGSVVYIDGKRLSNMHVWHVSWVSSSSEVKCTCQRMESLRIPCENIISLLHYLEISELPDCLVLKRKKCRQVKCNRRSCKESFEYTKGGSDAERSEDRNESDDNIANVGDPDLDKKHPAEKVTEGQIVAVFANIQDIIRRHAMNQCTVVKVAEQEYEITNIVQMMTLMVAEHSSRKGNDKKLLV
ncbi:FAR1-related protein [Sesbania bispinosa]|nr:FAR1-related protein [Sesbania bispinosa]